MKTEHWQPIETAPRNGKQIIIAWKEGRHWRQRMVCWERRFSCDYDSAKEKARYTGAWTDGAVASFYDEECQSYSPTHWMPIPDPPASAV